MTDDAKVLEDIVEQNQRLIFSLGPCKHCGRSTDDETLFKAQDRILKALTLKRRVAPRTPGSAFGDGE